MSYATQTIRGTCPACGTGPLFIGSGGHITCSWIDCPNPTAVDELLNPVQGRGKAIGDVWEERDHQDRRKAAGRFVATCADAGAMTNAERLAVLVEEVGEVAHEVLTQDGRRLARDTVGTVEALRGELVQVAAVAVAWVEGLDQEYP